MAKNSRPRRAHGQQGRWLHSINTAAACLVTVLLCFACNVPNQSTQDRQSLVLDLPDMPAAWTMARPEDFAWMLTYTDCNGGEASTLFDPTHAPVIEVEQSATSMLVVFPVLRGHALRPAGAEYPLDCVDLEIAARDPLSPFGKAGQLHIKLSWEAGYAALIGQRLAHAGEDLSRYNWAKLTTEAFARCQDPWNFDWLEMARRLRDGAMRSDVFKTLPVFSVELPLAGPWMGESPFAPTVTLGEKIIALPAGRHRYFGVEKVIDIMVTDDGEMTWVCVQ